MLPRAGDVNSILLQSVSLQAETLTRLLHDFYTIDQKYYGFVYPFNHRQVGALYTTYGGPKCRQSMMDVCAAGTEMCSLFMRDPAVLYTMIYFVTPVAMLAG